MATKYGFGGAGLIDPLTVRAPAALTKLEQGRRVPGGGLPQVVEDLTVEMNAYQGQERPGLAVAGPQDLVMPVGVFPTNPLDRVDLRERSEEPGFEPFALEAKKFSSVVDMELFGELTNGSSQDEPADDDAGRNHASPDD